MLTRANVRCFVGFVVLIGWTSLTAGQSTKLAVGYSGISADQLVIWVARTPGFSPRTISRYSRSISPAAPCRSRLWFPAIHQLSRLLGPGMISAGLAGADPIYVVGGIVSLDYWLMTQPEVKTAEHLKGGTIAVARFGPSRIAARYLGSKKRAVAENYESSIDENKLPAKQYPTLEGLKTFSISLKAKAAKPQDFVLALRRRIRQERLHRQSLRPEKIADPARKSFAHCAKFSGYWDGNDLQENSPPRR